MKRRQYWLTFGIPADDATEAEARAAQILGDVIARAGLPGVIIDVQPAPPQGATIVGDMHEDSLP